MHPIYLKQIHTIYWSEFTIGIGALQENYAHRKIREILLRSVGVGRCLGWSNCCKFWLDNKQAVKYISSTELELNSFCHLPLGDLVWHLITQLNDSDISTYINLFDLRRDNHRCFIPFLVYDLVYPGIADSLVTLSTLSPWSDSFCSHTWSPFLIKPLLGWHRTFEIGLLINW